MKHGQLIEYNKRNISIYAKNQAGRLVLFLFFKNA